MQLHKCVCLSILAQLEACGTAANKTSMEQRDNFEIPTCVGGRPNCILLQKDSDQGGPNFLTRNTAWSPRRYLETSYLEYQQGRNLIYRTNNVLPLAVMHFASNRHVSMASFREKYRIDYHASRHSNDTQQDGAFKDSSLPSKALR